MSSFSSYRFHNSSSCRSNPTNLVRNSSSCRSKLLDVAAGAVYYDDVNISAARFGRDVRNGLLKYSRQIVLAASASRPCGLLERTLLLEQTKTGRHRSIRFSACFRRKIFRRKQTLTSGAVEDAAYRHDPLLVPRPPSSAGDGESLAHSSRGSVTVEVLCEKNGGKASQNRKPEPRRRGRPPGRRRPKKSSPATSTQHSGWTGTSSSRRSSLAFLALLFLNKPLSLLVASQQQHRAKTPPTTAGARGPETSNRAASWFTGFVSSCPILYPTSRITPSPHTARLSPPFLRTLPPPHMYLAALPLDWTHHTDLLINTANLYPLCET